MGAFLHCIAKNSGLSILYVSVNVQPHNKCQTQLKSWSSDIVGAVVLPGSTYDARVVIMGIASRFLKNMFIAVYTAIKYKRPVIKRMQETHD